MSNEERYITEEPTLQEVVKCKRALNRMQLPAPDVDEAWQQFERKHIATPTAGKNRRTLLIGFVSGVAASLLLFFVIDRFLPEVSVEKDVQVFSATAPQDKVILSVESGETYAFTPQTDSTLHINDVTTKQEVNSSATAHARWMTLTTPRGEDFRVTLPDGTAVWMNADTRLMFPENFTGSKREVKLQGEAYFEVARDKSRPFEVTNDFFTTSVLGTEFNVRAYSPEDAYLVLVNGKVALQGKEQATTQIIEPGQKAQWSEQGNFSVTQVDTYAYTQWKEGYFYFDNVPLVEIMQELGRWYNIDILFENTDAMHTRLHFVADRNQDLGFALSNLNALHIVMAVQREGKVIIR